MHKFLGQFSPFFQKNGNAVKITWERKADPDTKDRIPGLHPISPVHFFEKWNDFLQSPLVVVWPCCSIATAVSFFHHLH